MEKTSTMRERCQCCGGEMPALLVRDRHGRVTFFEWTRMRLGVKLKGGDVVNRFEMWPLGPEHGYAGSDVGRKLVRDVSVSNPNWTTVDYVVDV